MKKIFSSKFLSLALCFTLALSLSPDVVQTAQAVGIQRGMSGITIDKVVGFCGHQWYVIGYNDGYSSSGVYSGTSSTMTLLARSTFGSSPFYEGALYDPNMNVYAGNKLYTEVNELLGLPEISGREEALIIARDLPDVNILTTDQKLWPLSVAEANAVSNSTRSFYGSWWLRSQGAYGARFAVYVDSAGIVNANGADVTSDFLIRPALCLDISSVLFTSAVGGKSGDVGSLLEADPPTGGIKLTVKDNVNISLDVTSPNFMSAKQGETVYIDYTATRASMLGNFYVSCVIENSSGVQYYGKLVEMPNYGEKSGTAEIQLPADIPVGDYTLRLFYEQINGYYITDFASVPEDIALTVKSSLIELGTPGSPAWDASTPAKATWSAVTGASDYALRLFENGTLYDRKVAAVTNFDFTPYITETGSYTFDVRARGDEITYKDGDYSAKSTAYVYTAPSAKLAAPGSLAWDASMPAKATWGSVSGASSYSVQLYKNGTACGSAKTGITVVNYDFASDIMETGSYTFTVMAIGDGTIYSNSDMSAVSATYNHTAPITSPTATSSATPTATPTTLPTTGSFAASSAAPTTPLTTASFDTQTATPTIPPVAKVSNIPTETVTSGERITITPSGIWQDETTGKIVVEISVDSLPEGATAMQLSDGDVIRITDVNSSKIQLEISLNDINGNGELVIIPLNNQGTPLSPCNIRVMDDEGQFAITDTGDTGDGNNGTATWMWLLICIAIVAFGILVACVLLQKKYSSDSRR